MQSSEFICGTHKGSSHTKTHTHTHRHTHRHTQTHTRTQLHSHTDTDTHAHKHTHSRTHKAIHTCRLSTALISITPPAAPPRLTTWSSSKTKTHACTCVCVCVCVQVWERTSVDATCVLAPVCVRMCPVCLWVQACVFQAYHLGQQHNKKLCIDVCT